MKDPQSRRDFLRRGAGLAATTLLWPERLDALTTDLGRTEPGTREYWEVVRSAFLIPEDRLYLNVGTLGPQPRAVVDAVLEHTRRVAMTYPPGVDWDALKSRVGGFINAEPAGLVFPRNTTEAMSFVANGIDFRPGDEILTTNHEHIGGLCCWQVAAARHGLTLRQLPLPVPGADADEIVGVFRRAITPRTRVISVSHVTFTTGAILPVREIAAVCREHGIISVVDGAHPPGMMRVDVLDIGADFYASSPHKWLLAPQGSGLLYIAAGPWRDTIWPSVASGGWDDRTLGAHRLNHMGTMDESRLAGLDAALRFQQAIGIDRVSDRVRALRRMLVDRLAGLPRVRIVSPRDATRGAGMVSFEADGMDGLALQQRLAERANVRTRVIGEYGYGWMRLSPHIYNLEPEIERVVELIAEALA